VPDSRRLAEVEKASVDHAPANWCSCAAPLWPGNTIGSSGAMCDVGHTVKKSGGSSAIALDGTRNTAINAIM